ESGAYSRPHSTRPPPAWRDPPSRDRPGRPRPFRDPASLEWAAGDRNQNVRDRLGCRAGTCTGYQGHGHEENCNVEMARGGLTGSVLDGRYRIGSVIAKVGMSTVYRGL